MTVNVDCYVEFNEEGITTGVFIGEEAYGEPPVILSDLCRQTVGYSRLASGELLPSSEMRIEWMRDQLVDALAYLDSIEQLKYIVYGTPACGYYRQAKKLLDHYGIPFDCTDLAELTSYQKTVIMEASGEELSTWPQIFKERKDGLHYVGGFEELKKELK